MRLLFLYYVSKTALGWTMDMQMYKKSTEHRFWTIVILFLAINSSLRNTFSFDKKTYSRLDEVLGRHFNFYDIKSKMLIVAQIHKILFIV